MQSQHDGGGSQEDVKRSPQGGSIGSDPEGGSGCGQVELG